jgi:hypothetical protein
MPPLDTTMSASDEAADLRNSLALLSKEEREAIMGGGVGDEASDELTVINELSNNGDKEERVITKDDLGEPEEATGKNNDLSDESDDDEADEQAQADTESADQQAVAEAAAAQALAQEQAADTAPADLTFSEPVYVPVPPPVADFDARMAAIQAERAEANRLLLAGELAEAEFSAKDSKTLMEMMALNSAQDRHLAAVDQNEAIATTAWTRDVATIKAIAKSEGVDYDSDPKMMKAWDGWVKQLAADDTHADKPANFFLKEAHRLTKLQYNLADVVQEQPKAPAAKANPPAKPAARQNRAPDLSQIPPTLAHAPAAAIESEGDTGEFAHIDKLQGIAQEQALARLTPDQQERYLQG